jgi:hypothetical protein
MNRIVIVAAAGVLSLVIPVAAVTADEGGSSSAATPRVLNVVLTHRTDTDSPPYSVVFATDAKLNRARDDENVMRYAGDVLVNDGKGLDLIGGAASPEDGPRGHRQRGTRRCYAADGLYRDGNLRVGRTYSVRITLSNEKGAPATERLRKLKTRSIEHAAKALGC